MKIQVYDRPRQKVCFITAGGTITLYREGVSILANYLEYLQPDQVDDLIEALGLARNMAKLIEPTDERWLDTVLSAIGGTI